MYNIKVKLIFTVLIAIVLVSCSGTPKENAKLNSSSSNTAVEKTAKMKMGLIVLFKKNTSYLDISELNQKLPQHIHEVVKSKKLFKYSFESHENYMASKELLTDSDIVEAVTIDQGTSQR